MVFSGGLTTNLAEQTISVLDTVRVLPRRLWLNTPGVAATAPMLRGVWGAALHDLDPVAYEAVFSGAGEPHMRAPCYVIRPGPPGPGEGASLDWVLIGGALAHDTALLRAWDVASGMGLGPERRRFQIRRMEQLPPQGRPVKGRGGESGAGWLLGDAARRWLGPVAEAPCRMRFPVPLRLMYQGRLVESPALPDLVITALRRLVPYLPLDTRAELARLEEPVLELARKRSAGTWVGQRLDLVRYSGRQKSELEMRGISGYLDLPQGPGELGPLLAVGEWLHLGKSTTVGLGQLVVD